jgi:hypothetical protein
MTFHQVSPGDTECIAMDAFFLKQLAHLSMKAMRAGMSLWEDFALGPYSWIFYSFNHL